MNACLLCVSLACIYENALVDPPFAFTIHFVLAERYVLELILNTGLVHPATNIVICCPPEQIRDEQSSRRVGIGRAILLSLNTLLRSWCFLCCLVLMRGLRAWNMLLSILSTVSGITSLLLIRLRIALLGIIWRI